MKKDQFLALDFDGVISDSILECLVTAQNAFAAFNDSEEFSGDISQFMEDEIAEFRASRVFIRRGEDYVFLRLAADQGHPLRSQDEFDEFLEIHASKRDIFRELFYNMRARLQTSNQGEWLALNPLYPEMETFLKEVKNTDSIYIVTTKDLLSVQLILESRGITLDPEHMFQATKSTGKPEILLSIVESLKLQKHHIHFIDDHPGTVLEVAQNAGVSSYCAEWGYNNPAQLDALITAGIPILTMDDFLNEFGRTEF